jgi:hypothetical protein
MGADWLRRIPAVALSLSDRVALGQLGHGRLAADIDTAESLTTRYASFAETLRDRVRLSDAADPAALPRRALTYLDTVRQSLVDRGPEATESKAAALASGGSQWSG